MTSVAINPRKSPKQARAQATFNAIVEAATRILTKDGLGKLNTNHIARVAGVSIGTLYQYFPSKEAILAEVIRQKRRLLLDGLKAATQDMHHESFDETLDKLLLATITHQLQWARLARTLKYAEAFLPLGEETTELKAAITETVATFLLHQNCDTPKQNACDLVAALRGLIDGAGLAGETDHQAIFVRARKLATGFLC